MNPPRLFAYALLLLALAAGGARAECLDGRPLRGVNFAGAEFNARTLPGIRDRNYTFPRRTDIEYFAQRGITAVRLPVLWGRLQPALFEPLDPTYLAAIAETVEVTTKLGLCLILDLHNYGGYGGQPLGSETAPVEALLDVWKRLAHRFPDERHVALGLMNEPHRLPIALWVDIAHRTLTGLREGGAPNLILVAGGRWSGAHEWFKTFAGVSNAEALARFRDPLGRLAIEVHQYADTNYSGTGTLCHPPDHFDPMFRALAEWAQLHGHRLFLGEFGTAASADCLASLDRLLHHASGAAWAGWTYWAAGAWWGTYPLNIAPRPDGSDAPQMAILTRYLGQ